MNPRVAYQGGPGANGEAAVHTHWNGRARAVPVRSFPALVDAVADGGVEFGVVPVWNSTIGPVREACDALAQAGERVVQVGEVTLPVRHALLALPGTSLAQLRAVGSHRAALAQCGRWLRSHGHVEPVVAWDTAGAARELSALRSALDALMAEGARTGLQDELGTSPWYSAVPAATPRTLGVIANPAVAGRYGLAVLAEDIQDDPHNATRFAVVRTREGAWAW